MSIRLFPTPPGCIALGMIVNVTGGGESARNINLLLARNMGLCKQITRGPQAVFILPGFINTKLLCLNATKWCQTAKSNAHIPGSIQRTERCHFLGDAIFFCTASKFFIKRNWTDCGACGAVTAWMLYWSSVGYFSTKCCPTNISFKSLSTTAHVATDCACLLPTTVSPNIDKSIISILLVRTDSLLLTLIDTVNIGCGPNLGSRKEWWWCDDGVSFVLLSTCEAGQESLGFSLQN